jgi:RNA-binding protein YhbY
MKKLSLDKSNQKIHTEGKTYILFRKKENKKRKKYKYIL